MSRNDKELADLNSFGKIGNVVADKWKIKKLLDEGGFGRVFLVHRVNNPHMVAALKIESRNMDGGSAIKLEKEALHAIHQKVKKPHVPILFSAARKKNICYMIVTLLGDSIKKLKEKNFPDTGFPVKTWVRIAIQTLVGIKIIHDAGYVHRDIKAANFTMGHPDQKFWARMVYILDFGLSRRYAIPNNKTGAMIPRRARKRMDFRGTHVYAAPIMHSGEELGRRDDIYSWIYFLIDIFSALPWTNCESVEEIAVLKLTMPDSAMCELLPEGQCFAPLFPHLKSLTVYSRPDYEMIYGCVKKVFDKVKANFLDPYEWETKEQSKLFREAIEKDKEKPIYMNPLQFFKEDPIGFNTREPQPGDARLDKKEENEDEDKTNKTEKSECSQTIDYDASRKGDRSEKSGKMGIKTPNAKTSKTECTGPATPSKPVKAFAVPAPITVAPSIIPSSNKNGSKVESKKLEKKGSKVESKKIEKKTSKVETKMPEKKTSKVEAKKDDKGKISASGKI